MQKIVFCVFEPACLGVILLFNPGCLAQAASGFRLELAPGYCLMDDSVFVTMYLKVHQAMVFHFLIFARSCK